MGYLLLRLATLVFALLLIARLVPGVSVDSLYTALVVAVLLGLINITIKPLLLLLTLPLTLITLGLFALVVNAALFWFVATFVEGFSVDGFVPAFIGALILSLVNWAVSKLT